MKKTIFIIFCFIILCSCSNSESESICTEQETESQTVVFEQNTNVMVNQQFEEPVNMYSITDIHNCSDVEFFMNDDIESYIECTDEEKIELQRFALSCCGKDCSNSELLAFCMQVILNRVERYGIPIKEEISNYCSHYTMNGKEIILCTYEPTESSMIAIDMIMKREINTYHATVFSIVINEFYRYDDLQYLYSYVQDDLYVDFYCEYEF